MKLLFEGRQKIKIIQVGWIIISWTLIGILDALNTHAISFGPYLFQSEDYSFSRYFWFNVVTSLVAGIVSGSVLVFYLREQLRVYSFGFAVLVSSFLISVANFIISAIAFNLFFSYQLEKSVLDPLVIEETTALLGSGIYFKNLVFWTIVVSITIITLNINDKYGPGVLIKLILGRYYRPREEARIFMFADIKSSTTIAEKLGNTRFFNLVNDFFRDLTNPILQYKGEVYQYVGDEIVLVWTMKNGTKNANCIRAFYAMREAIQKNADRYKERYGLVPEFKVGAHCGPVTVGEIGVIKKDVVFSGDVLNTTSRIQNLCNKFRVKILLSKYLLEKLQLPPNEFQPKRMGIIELKGKKQKLELYTFEENVEQLEIIPLKSS